MALSVAILPSYLALGPVHQSVRSATGTSLRFLAHPAISMQHGRSERGLAMTARCSGIAGPTAHLSAASMGTRLEELRPASLSSSC